MKSFPKVQSHELASCFNREAPLVRQTGARCTLLRCRRWPKRRCKLVLPPKAATMTPPLPVTMRRDDLRKKFPRPPDLDGERQSTGIGTGHVSAPSRRTH